MTIQHQLITDPNVHEPKGITTAASSTVYVANGVGSGSWRKHDFSMTYTIADASIAGPTNFWIVVPYQSLLAKAYVIVDAAFSANQTIAFQIGGVPVTGGTINLLTAGSGAGSIYSCTPSALNAISAGAGLKIVNTGGSAAPFIAELTLIFTPTA
jgi:hypothetical protein